MNVHRNDRSSDQVLYIKLKSNDQMSPLKMFKYFF